MTLDEIETQLQSLLEYEKRTWTKTAQLLLQVERQGLFKEKARSFTQYIRQLAKRFKMHESNFWRIKKAGEYYLKLNETDDLEVITQAKANPEQIEILNKIRTVAPMEIVQDLEKKMLAGEMTQKEFREIWKAYRPAKEGKTERGRKPKQDKQDKQNKQDKQGESAPSVLVSTSFENEKTKTLVVSNVLTAANILEALRNSHWMAYTFNQETIARFQIFKEIAVDTGTSQHARRIDVVAAVKETYKGTLPTILGVEIKVSERDLKQDIKMTEYQAFCHYFYLAIPSDTNMIQLAIEVLTEDIGILCITDTISEGKYQIQVLRKALPLHPSPALVGEVYGKLLYHALKW